MGPALSQSWAFPDAREVYQQCRHSRLMANMMSSPLAHHLRREIVANGVLALLETTKIDLIHWLPAEQMLSPDAFRERYSKPDELANPIFGFLNVRLFNVSDSGGDIVMDTLGLGALGLTDFQIHFRKLEANSVAQLLYDVGAYAFENGDVIQHGHTVQGVDEGRWKCRREMSLVAPQREVIDINPGPEFVAGNRS
jgi:hypothetical protein